MLEGGGPYVRILAELGAGGRRRSGAIAVYVPHRTRSAFFHMRRALEMTQYFVILIIERASNSKGGDGNHLSIMTVQRSRSVVFVFQFDDIDCALEFL